MSFAESEIRQVEEVDRRCGVTGAAVIYGKLAFTISMLSRLMTV